jgi:hypothetical protein
MEPTINKKKKNRSPESNKKKNNSNVEKRKDMVRFVEMCKKEFPRVANTLNKHTLPPFLFELAGYTYDRTTFEIIARPFSSLPGISKLTSHLKVKDDFSSLFRENVIQNTSAVENTQSSMDILELEVLRQVFIHFFCKLLCSKLMN